jgi:dynein heavy chain
VKQVHFKIHLLPTGGQGGRGTIERVGKGGCIIFGLFIEGARWDEKGKKLVEARPKIFYEPLPPILLEPSIEAEDQTSSPYIYPCPVYRTQMRSGDILPTGHSTNYIFQLDLPSDHPPEHWINRGVAASLELCDT